MRGLPYYEEPEYHTYLLSPARKELFPVDQILSQIRWQGVNDLLDFGMGNGYFLSGFYRYLPEGANIWGAECQEALIDHVLKLKATEEYPNLVPFYTERTEHPLLPDWIPEMDLVFCSCVLSTFADPSLALRGVSRSLKPDAAMIVIDWERNEAPSGPEVTQKVSQERMRFFIEDAGFKVVRTLKTNKHIYGLELMRNPDFKPEPAYALIE
ncbi:MAG: methyltransferase domain-containing protein [Spirochaetia bacterium]|nr:methyltransferase domain-containing protein [Spirochaetia bacterium]